MDLSVLKKEFRDFIKKHYNIVANSDMLQQFANQYMMMNEYVIVGKKKIEDQTVQDIRDWIVLLKDHYTDQEVVHYFLKYYRGRLMITMSGAIMDAFPKQAPCNIPKGFTAGGIIPAANKKTLYIVIDPDCPASITGQVMINRFIKENKINVPVITVFTGRAPGQGDYRVLPDIEHSQVMLKGIAQIDNKEVKIEKYPAFILVNDEGKVTAKEYSLASIKEKLLPE